MRLANHMDFIKNILAVFLLITLPIKLYGQQVDNDTLGIRSSKNYDFKWKQTVLPISLIGIGAIAIKPSFIRNGSNYVTKNVIDLRGNNNRLNFDDYIQYVPAASMLIPDFVGIKSRHSLLERTCIVATSYATLAILTNVPKLCIDEKRPEFTGRNSFPSGHTAIAFMGAELVRLEYGGWYGAGAYAIATCVGFMRMYNGRHWFHDVIAGAGVGILSARLGEWSCRLWQKLLQKNKKDAQNFVVTPIATPFDGGYYGFTMGCSF